MVTAPLSRVYIAQYSDSSSIIGFALTDLIRAGSQWSHANAYLKGSLAALCVHPSHRNKGVGSALHAKALEYLTESVKRSFKDAEPQPERSQIQLGSIFPRIFPGLPEGEGELGDAKRWFEGRGWKFDDKKSIDLYRHLEPGGRSEMDRVMKKALDNDFTFGEPGEKDVEGLMQLQKDNFESYTVRPPLHPLSPEMIS